MAEGSSKHTILILADGLPGGGTERQIVELLKGLRNHGDIVTAIGVLAKGGAREQEAAAYADICLPIRQSKPFDITLAYSLISLVREYQVDLIHTFGSVCDFCGSLAAKKTGIPVINGSIRSARPVLNIRDRISKVSMFFADWVVANSQAGLKAFGVDGWANCSVVRNGVDLSRFRKDNSGPRKHLSLCMVGNFTKKKDHAALIRAFPSVLRQFPETRLTLVGSGKLLSRCRKLIRELGLDGRVDTITDCLYPETIIRECTIGVLLSPGGEGISNVIIEYMALGIPVVATDLGGTRELVENGETGFLVPDHKPETVSQVICRLLKDPLSAAEMGRKGRARIEGEFSLEKMVGSYVLIYKNLLSQ